MCLLTTKISWITTTAPRGLADGSARYAASLWPSAAFNSIMLAMRPPPEKPAVRIAIMKKNARELFRLAKQALLIAGAHETMADTAAQHLVRAEEQGLPTHGMSRVPFYCSMLRNGRADGAPRPADADPIVVDLALTTVVRGKTALAGTDRYLERVET